MYLYFEAINFDAVLFDTADLGTMRGGSMAMDAVPGQALTFIQDRIGPDVTEDSGGASKVLLRCDGVCVEDLEMAARAFVTSPEAGPVSLTYGIGISRLAAQNDAVCRSDQMWSFPLPDPAEGLAACPEDLTRPATVKETGPNGKDRMISAHVDARRAKGRWGRPRLYQRTEDLAPALSLDDICAASEPLRQRLAAETPVVPGKLAVIVIDGAGGGRLADTVNTANHPNRMSDLLTAFYERVADGLLSWALRFGLDYDGEGKRGEPQRRARMDVLTWAGDDMTFFLPGYAAIPFIQEFLRLIDVPFDPEGPPDLRFRHRIGMVLGQQKVPVRQLISVAQRLEKAGNAKIDAGSIVTAVALESSAPPHGSIESYWSALYGSGHRPDMESFTAREFGAFADLCSRITDPVSAGPLSPTQLNRVLQRLGVPQTPVMPEDPDTTSRLSNRARELIAEHRDRVHGEVFETSSLTDGLGKRPLPLVLAQIAQLAPYVRAGEIASEVVS